MIVLTANASGPKTDALFAGRSDIGQLLSPVGWRQPGNRPYACDNDVFANRHDPDWWARKGASAWFGMLEKIPADNPPLWVLLPDVVADWPETMLRARRYVRRVRRMGFRVAIALQDGADFEDAQRILPDTVFVGGSRQWKWENVARIARYFKRRGIGVHVGRVSGPIRLAACARLGVDSCDGTGWTRHSDKMLPGLFRALDGQETRRLHVQHAMELAR